ncbi:MAG: hypothetical protein QI197_01855 [Candidatus Korarchaeota archaeon]|nr:hypothetical protein [Candidatus Korarchaeota archaeon]
MSKLIKSRVLIEEAEKDLEHGSYNKAVSASYFATRLLVEHLIGGLKTSKDDKIANALQRRLEERIGEERARDIKERYLKLFMRRKIADHKPYLFSKDEAEWTVMEAKRLMEEIMEALSPR